ncbi:MAG: hypothetical protein FJX02_15910 [Alphaproteobacteria bacterium]|nr:hypothetical protein [Alphaproteobacteria bacterium]MBM4210388.1 hypothetical protein [Gammaproteobacteria bacterium]
MAAADTLIARLQADCTDAEREEGRVREAFDAAIKAAELRRAFAWRRLSALSDMARIAATEPDRAEAVRRQLVALFREIGWIEGDLAELGEGSKALVGWLTPIAETLHAAAHPSAEGETEPAMPADPLAAFRAFEAWYEAEHGRAFLEAFERWVPETPKVEF